MPTNEQNAREVSSYVAAANAWHEKATDEEKKQGFPSFAQWLETQGAKR